MTTWLIKIVEGRYRCWDDFLAYGMVSAGHDNPPGAPLKRLSIGDEVYAYLNSRGYVGRGEVTNAARLADDFVVDGDFVSMDGSMKSGRVKLTEIVLLRRSAMLPFGQALMAALNAVISFVLITVLFAAIYKVLPDRALEWRDVLVGAAVTSLLFVIGKSLIGWYLGSSAIGSAYGAAGALIILLFWVYYSVQIFLLGAEFTKVYAKTHDVLLDRFGL